MFLVFLFFFCILSILSYKPFSKVFLKQPESETVVINRKIYLGFWTQGFWDDSTQTLHPEKLRELERKVGKTAAIAHYFRGWSYLQNPSVVAELNAISSNNWRPMVSANPYFFEDCPSLGSTLYRAISDGNCDQFLHNVARNLKKVKNSI